MVWKLGSILDVFLPLTGKVTRSHRLCTAVSHAAEVWRIQFHLHPTYLVKHSGSKFTSHGRNWEVMPLMHARTHTRVLLGEPYFCGDLPVLQGEPIPNFHKSSLRPAEALKLDKWPWAPSDAKITRLAWVQCRCNWLCNNKWKSTEIIHLYKSAGSHSITTNHSDPELSHPQHRNAAFLPTTKGSVCLKRDKIII